MYTPFIDLRVKGKLKRIYLSTEPNLKAACAARMNYIAENGITKQFYYH